MRQVGERVTAISHGAGDVIYVFGDGIYEGDFVPGPEAEGFAAWAREAGITNPRIRLDSGEVVYGGECWWGPIDQVAKKIDGRTVITVTVAERRAQAATGGQANGDRE